MAECQPRDGAEPTLRTRIFRSLLIAAPEILVKPINNGAAIIRREAMFAFRTLVAAAVSTFAIWVVGSVLAPEKTQNIYDSLRGKIEVAIAPDCNIKPVACLLRLEHNLEEVSTRLNSTRASLETKSVEADDLVTHNREMLAQNRLYLSQGRKILRSAPASGPISFIGTEYPTAERLQEQLELLFREGHRLADASASSEAVSEKLKVMRRDIIAQRSEVLAALASIPSKIALAEVEKSYATLESDLTRLDDLASGGQADEIRADELLRSTSRLNLDAARTSEGDEDFVKWLAGSDA